MNLFKSWLAGRRSAPDPAPLLRLAARMPLAAGLGSAERDRLAELAQRLLRKKSFEAAGGLRLSEQMCQVVALQACLPVLQLGLELYQGWHSFILYPGDFRTRHEFHDAAGVVHQGHRDLSGEAWLHGPVILSWPDVEADAYDPEPDGNLVIHEMSHKLDMLNGVANGMPPLHSSMDPQRWSQDLQAAFDDLNRRLDWGEEAPIDPYAATAPEEFFAVTSELFFAWPEPLAAAYPAVYRQLQEYYRQDPLRRWGSAGLSDLSDS